MNERMKKWKVKLSPNEAATVSFLKSGVYAIVIAVVGYADIAFIQIMSKHFLGGIFGVLSMIGAVATAASIVALLFGKAIWFRPGKQLKFAYFFTGAEVMVSLLNVLLAFELTSNQGLDQLMATWYNFTAATPFVALIGWILILQFDKSQQERHEHLEFEEETAALERDQQREQQLAQLEHQQKVFEAQMQLSNTYLEHEVAYMQQFVNSPQVQERLQTGAMKMAMETFSKLTGLPFVAGFPPMQQSAQTPVQPGQHTAGQPPAFPVPTHVPLPQQPPSSNSFYENLEHLYNTDPVAFAQLMNSINVQEPTNTPTIRPASLPQSPLGQPHLVPNNPDQAGATANNGTNGHQ
jgi:hypothetical protein